MAPNNENNDEPMPYVYLRSREHAWVPGRVLKSDGKTATVVVQKYKSEEEMILNTDQIFQTVKNPPIPGPNQI